jgi:hypothetical protein
VGDGGRRDQLKKHRRLTEEVGISPARWQAERALVLTLKVLAFAGLALFFLVGFAYHPLLWIGPVLFAGAAVPLYALGSLRLRRIKKVRWQDGTVTFRTVEPGEVGETGQRVYCEVELNPAARVVYEVEQNPMARFARVFTTVGPLDTERLVVGATMRCIFDRIESPFLLRAFPYAELNAPLPTGRELKFRRAKAKS